MSKGGHADKCQLSSVSETDPQSSPLCIEESLETSEGDNWENSEDVFPLLQNLPQGFTISIHTHTPSGLGVEMGGVSRDYSTLSILS